MELRLGSLVIDLAAMQPDLRCKRRLSISLSMDEVFDRARDSPNDTLRALCVAVVSARAWDTQKSTFEMIG